MNTIKEGVVWKSLLAKREWKQENKRTMKNLILKPEKETSVRKIELQNWNYPNNREKGSEGGSGMF